MRLCRSRSCWHVHLQIQEHNSPILHLVHQPCNSPALRGLGSSKFSMAPRQIPGHGDGRCSEEPHNCARAAAFQRFWTMPGRLQARGCSHPVETFLLTTDYWLLYFLLTLVDWQYLSLSFPKLPCCVRCIMCQHPQLQFWWTAKWINFSTSMSNGYQLT